MLSVKIYGGLLEYDMRRNILLMTFENEENSAFPAKMNGMYLGLGCAQHSPVCGNQYAVNIPLEDEVVWSDATTQLEVRELYYDEFTNPTTVYVALRNGRLVDLFAQKTGDTYHQEFDAWVYHLKERFSPYVP